MRLLTATTSIAAFVLLATSAQAAPRRSPPTFPGARSLLWVGAHPDDETIAAPLLGRLCREEGLHCAFLVITTGERKQCRLPNGCHPDLGSVRASEMRHSARVFGAELTQWTLPDGGAMSGWATAAGGAGALVSQAAALMQSVNPDVVLTFDPRHGSTCHPDHQAAGELVLEAVGHLSRPPTVYLLETVVSGSTVPFSISYTSGGSTAQGTIGFDANQSLPALRSSAWQFTLLAAQAHPSQFVPSAIRGLARLPSSQRVVFIAPSTQALLEDPAFTCN